MFFCRFILVNSIEKELILNRVGGFLFLLFVFNYTIDLFFWECPKMRKTYLFKDDGRRDVYMYVCLFVGKEGKMGFRAAHDQRLAAGPRQGHSVLDPEKMHPHFSAL